MTERRLEELLEGIKSELGEIGFFLFLILITVIVNTCGR